MNGHLKSSTMHNNRSNKPPLHNTPGIECPHCRTINSSAARYCISCGMNVNGNPDMPEPRSRGHPPYRCDSIPHHHTCPVF